MILRIYLFCLLWWTSSKTGYELILWSVSFFHVWNCYTTEKKKLSGHSDVSGYSRCHQLSVPAVFRMLKRSSAPTKTEISLTRPIYSICQFLNAKTQAISRHVKQSLVDHSCRKVFPKQGDQKTAALYKHEIRFRSLQRPPFFFFFLNLQAAASQIVASSPETAEEHVRFGSKTAKPTWQVKGASRQFKPNELPLQEAPLWLVLGEITRNWVLKEETATKNKKGTRRSHAENNAVHRCSGTLSRKTGRDMHREQGPSSA